MINEHLDRTIAALMSDAEFMNDFPEKLESFNASRMTKEEEEKMMKRAAILVLHIIDYCVSADSIDMDADLSRLCLKSPMEASRLRESLNMAGLSLKNNYQYLFREGTIYADDVQVFTFLYGAILGLSIDIKHGADISKFPPVPIGTIVLDFSDFEFIYADEEIVLEKKFQRSRTLDFTLETVKDFISNCFKWSDTIKECLDRAYTNKTVINIESNRLHRLHVYCNGQAYTNTTPEKFSMAIMGYSNPDFHVIHKDFFYSVLYAIYTVLGPLCPRDAWLRGILLKFDLSENDYYNAKSRLDGKGKHTYKLIERYMEIRRILEE